MCFLLLREQLYPTCQFEIFGLPWKLKCSSLHKITKSTDNKKHEMQSSVPFQISIPRWNINNTPAGCCSQLGLHNLILCLGSELRRTNVPANSHGNGCQDIFMQLKLHCISLYIDFFKHNKACFQNKCACLLVTICTLYTILAIQQ